MPSCLHSRTPPVFTTSSSSDSTGSSGAPPHFRLVLSGNPHTGGCFIYPVSASQSFLDFSTPCIIEDMLQNKIPPNLCCLLAHVFVGHKDVLSVPGQLGWTWNVLSVSLTGLGPQLSWLSGLEGWDLCSWDFSSSRSRDWCWLS